MSETDFKIIIIPHTGDDIHGDMKYEGGEYPAEEIINIADKDINYVLFHFPQKNNRKDILEVRSILKEEIAHKNNAKKNIIILPISKGCTQKDEPGCKHARSLYELIKDIQDKNGKITSDNLESYVSYWGEKAEEEAKVDSKKEIIPIVLSFCLYCENVYKFNSFENNKMKIQEELKKIKKSNFEVKFEFPENIKEKWHKMEGLLDSNDKLKKDEMKKFIGLNEDGSKVPMEETEWLTLLGNLKEWAVKADDQN